MLIPTLHPNPEFLCSRTGLHRALYWGHLRAAALLLDAGAQLSVLDHRVRALRRGQQGAAACHLLISASGYLCRL